MLRFLTVLFATLSLVQSTAAFEGPGSGPRYTKPDGKESTDPTAVYGQMPHIMGTVGPQNTLWVGQYNNAPAGTIAYPTAITGHCENHSVGGTCFAGYFEAQAFKNGVVTTEIDAFNKGGRDAPATYPWARGFNITTPLPIAITCGAGGPNKSAACMEIVREGSSPGQFQFGFAFQKDAVLQAGIYMDADATSGPKHNLVLRNTGQAGAIPVMLQTMGPDNAAPSIQHATQSGAINWFIGNDGAGSFANYLSVIDAANPDIRWRNVSAAADAKNWSATTDRSGTWHLRAVNDAYARAVDALTIRRDGIEPTTVEFSVPLKLNLSRVSSLPRCTTALNGAMIAVTDAQPPTYRGPLTGGGSISVPAYCNGRSWEAH